MKKIYLVFLLIIFCCTACNNNVDKKTDENIESNINSEKSGDMSAENIQTDSEPTEEVNYIFNDIRYLNRDNLFLLSSDGEKYCVTTEGEATPLSETRLNSVYLNYDSDRMMDIYGNDITDLFIKDTQHEHFIGVYWDELQDYVWVYEKQESPMESIGIMKAFDEKGTELFRIDSQSREEGVYFGNVRNCGEGMCLLYNDNSMGGLLIDTNTWQIILDTGEWGFFSDGYATIRYDGEYERDGRKIIDKQGNIVVEGDNLGDVGNGLLFDEDSKSFVDLNFNKVLDFNMYNEVDVTGKTYDYRERRNFVFKDGYSEVTIRNEGGTEFYGIIDTAGNYVMDLTDAIGVYAYYGKVAEHYLLFSSTGEVHDSYVIDLNSKELRKLPMPVANSDCCFIVGKKIYFLSENGIFKRYDGEFSCYDLETQRFETIPILVKD